ncbi:MAG: hypothetical protein KDD42_08035 [Bdellovibrionales bacterium]|nr:hypothetical protein [Bdellovibrionales bacterium]
MFRHSLFILALFLGLTGASFAQNIDLSVSVIRKTVGVKHWLSCHCANGAILRDLAQKIIPACFSEEAIFSCEKLKVWGRYQESQMDPSSADSCPRESQKIFRVEEFECLE